MPEIPYFPEIVRFPSTLWSTAGDGKVTAGSAIYMSYTNAVAGPQVFNCLLLPAQRRVVLSIRMMILSRTGKTSNGCQFQFRVINGATGATVFTFPTTPAVLNPLTMPVMSWMDIHESAAGQVVDRGEYLGVVFTGVSGVMVAGSNDFVISPAIEVHIN